MAPGHANKHDHGCNPMFKHILIPTSLDGNVHALKAQRGMKVHSIVALQVRTGSRNIMGLTPARGPPTAPPSPHITVLENSFRNSSGITDEAVIIRYYCRGSF